MATTQFELVTPTRTLYSGQAEMIVCRTVDGEIAFLANHMPYIGALDIGVVRIVGPAGRGGGDEQPEIRLAVHGGFVEVKDNQVIMLADEAELADEIDVDAARRAEAEASRRGRGASGEDSRRGRGGCPALGPGPPGGRPPDRPSTAGLPAIRGRRCGPAADRGAVGATLPGRLGPAPDPEQGVEGHDQRRCREGDDRDGPVGQSSGRGPGRRAAPSRSTGSAPSGSARGPGA